MSTRIRVLDDALVDQIAAGEVVERPASVVKELLENALDAGATSITVEIERGGTSLVRVTDDGHGMDPENAVLAVRRHATSKIAAVEDLHRLHTLGFRGEALPSIASVSRFALTTRPREAEAGVRVNVDGGEQPRSEPIGCAPGTSVEVRELFFNVPARRKFLKKPATESAHVSEACLRAALAHPSLRLVLLRDGRRAHEYLPVDHLATRAKGVLPGAKLSHIEAEREGVTLDAVLGAPDDARSGTARLHVFVNGRPVKDRALSRAIAFAYGSVLPPGRYPVGVVHLRLDPDQVDVNVHPQKSEVRFAQGRTVLDHVTRMLAAKLGTTPWSGPAARGPQYWDDRLGGPRSEAKGSDPRRREPGDGGASPPPRAEGEGIGNDPWGLSGALRDATEPYAAAAAPPEPRPALTDEGFFSSLRVLGQARQMLIICEADDGLYVLDQHAADERVRYARLRAGYEAREVATQRLLFPERVEVTATEAALVEEHRDELLGLGLDCTLLGERTVAVHAVPRIVDRAPPERLLRDVVDELSRTGERAFGDAVDMALATMACHGAIRAGDALSPDECAALLRTMDQIGEFAGHCPHGRPVVYSVRWDEIERRLGR
ncbi:MAG: DNA mismatch repair endonuclease MutL [Polyangiales bacterium]